jgi:F-type H+-transporting ATPase subunit a
MGEHGTWFDFLNRFSFWQTLMEKADNLLGRKKPMLLVFQESHFTLTHVLVTMLVLGFVIYGALQFKAGLAGADGGLVPPRKMNIRNVFETMAESVYGMVEGAMGAHNAPRFFPLVGTLWLFILFGNLIGLIPGFISPNDTIKTNFALAGTVFVLTHVYGIREHGLAYFKHFLGPTPALAPLMLPIEIVSHIARPISLTLRLMGNMVADHKVVFSFFMLVPILVPHRHRGLRWRARPGQGRAAAALEGIARNPNASDKLFTPMILGLALIESLVIYALVIAYMLQDKIASSTSASRSSTSPARRCSPRARPATSSTRSSRARSASAGSCPAWARRRWRCCGPARTSARCR